MRYSTGYSPVINSLREQVGRLRSLLPGRLFVNMQRRYGGSGRALEGRRCDMLIVPTPRALGKDPGRAFQKVLKALGTSYGERFSTDLTPKFDAREACQSPLGDDAYAVLQFNGLCVGDSVAKNEQSRVDPALLTHSTNAGIFERPFIPDAYTVGILLLTNPRLVSELPDWFSVSSKRLVFRTSSEGQKARRRLKFLQTDASSDDTPLLHLEFARSQLH